MPETAAPLTEIGYQQGGGTGWWGHVEEESVPELRWPLSIDVYHRMRRSDAQVTSVLRAVTMPVGRTRWWVNPNGARPEVVEHVASDLGLPILGASTTDIPGPRRRTRDRFSWNEHLRLAMLYVVFGHSVFEQMYRVDNPDDPRKLHLRKLAWRPPRSISEFHAARDGGLDYITQYGYDAGAKAVRLDISRLVVYCHDREGAGWQGNSLLRPAYKDWILKDRLLRIQTQTIDRNGMGVPVYTGTEDEDDLSKGLAIARSLRSGDQSGTAIPHGSTLRLVGVEGQTPDAGPAVEYHDSMIARAVLANFLNLDGKGGSYALAAVQADTFIQSLQTLAQDLADTATAHIVEDLVDVNWGEDEPAPSIGFEEIGARQAATAQAMKLLVDAGILMPDRPLEEAVRQQHNLPPKDPNYRPRRALVEPAAAEPDPETPAEN